jgi:Rieske Fe-S protein
MAQADQPARPDRRDFFKEVCAGVLSALAGLVPLGAGLAVFFDPLRRKAQAGDFAFVAPLTALPEDGVPRKFPVVTTRADVWTRSPNVPVGAVYLRRTGPKAVSAFNVVCPHAGCFVAYRPESKTYLCPCHNSAFGLDGRIASSKSPAKRGLDELAVEIRNDTEVWVRFQNFRAGEKEKVPA